MATNYTELLTQTPLRLLAQNSDLVLNMIEIIRRAEELIHFTLDHDAFRTRITKTVTGSGGGEIDLTTELPRVLEVRSLSLGRGQGWIPLERRDLDYLTALYITGRGGTPLYYAEADEPLVYQVFPRLTRDATFRVMANQVPLYLSPSNETNVLTDEFPNLIESACLLKAAEWQKAPTDVEYYNQVFQTQLQISNLQIARRRGDNVEFQTQAVANTGATA